jgi:stage III sporulation protein AD
LIVKVFGLALLGAILTFTLKAFGWKGAPIVAVAAAISIFSFLGGELDEIGQIFDTVSGIEGMSEATETLLKVLFVGYVSAISSDICRELGEGGLASAVNLAARIETLILISPMILEILTLGLELVK